MTRVGNGCAAFLVSVLIAGAVQAQDAGGHRWPFGGDPAGGGRGRFVRYDLFNLGVIGAKARDADTPLPGPRRGGRRRSSRGRQNDGDAGPTKLFVEILFPQGPAERGGLKAGDLIVGVNKKSFAKTGSLGPLAAAIAKAQAKGKRKIVLRILRGGETLKLPILLGKAPKSFGKPTSTKGRRAILSRALAWLAEKQGGDGGFPATLSGTNGVQVQASLAGLAWLAGGSSQKKGRYAPNVDKAFKFLMRSLPAPGRGPRPGGGGANWDQSTWGWAHAGLFFGELYARDHSGLVRRELQKIADTLVQRQEKSGGWAHGPGGPNALNYLELNIQSCLVLQALGLARKAGCQVDSKAIRLAADYIQASSSADGGVGYSDKPGQKGMGNIGRTAGCFLAFQNLGLKRHPFFAKMKSWTTRHTQDVLGGHASLMQHILLAGLGAEAIGGPARARYWKAMRRDLILAQAPDGSLQPRPWHESLSMGSNSDVSFGQVWTTTAWAIVLGAEVPKGKKNRGLPALLGKLKGRAKN